MLDHLDAVRPETDETLQKLVDDMRGIFDTALCLVNLALVDVLYPRAWSGQLPSHMAEAREIPLDQSACPVVLETETPLVIENFLTDERFSEHDLCLLYGIRFYAGVPLTTSDGVGIGTLCVLDTEPKEFGEAQLTTLEAFGQAVVERLELLGAYRREQAAKEEEARRGRELRLALDNSRDMISTIGPDGSFRTMNPASRAILGYEPDELIGRDVLELIHPDDRERTLELSTATLEGELVTCFQNRFFRKDGGVAWIEWNATFLPEEGDIYCVGRDVTERRRTEEALRESEERYRRLVEGSPDAILVHSDGRIVYTNAACVKLLGASSPQALLGKPAMELIHPDYRELVRERVRQVQEEGSIVELAEEKLVALDGRVVDVEISGLPSTYGGRPAVQAIVRDISQRKQAEHSSKESEHRFRHLFEQSVDALLVHDASGRMVDCNSEAHRSLGYSREELLELSVKDFANNLVSDEEKRSKEDDTLWQRAMAGEPGKVIGGVHLGEHRRKDGTTFPVEVRVGGVDYGGERMIFASARDITERKRKEEEIKRLSRQNELILNSAGEGIFGLNLQGELDFVNPAAATMLGYEVGELIGRHQHYVVHHSRPDGTHYPVEECPIYAALRDENVHHGADEVFWRKDGTSFPVEYASTPIRENGELKGVVVTFSDITERKRTEAELIRLAYFSEQNPNPIFEVDSTGAVTYLNAAAREGFPELVGSGSRHPVLAGVAGAAGAMRAKGRTSLVYEVEAGDRYYEQKIAVVSEDATRVYLNDVSRRKRSEKALRESEERFRSLVQHSSDIAMILEADGTVRYKSLAVERVLGYRPEDVVGKNVFDYVHPDDAVGELRTFMRALDDQGEKPPTAEIRFRHKDGSWRYCEVVGNNLLDDPSVKGIVLNSRDITERKALEERMIHQAFHDSLTGLPNRALFLDRLQHALARTDRREESVAVLFLDLDNFKVVNDSLGHEVGDRLLVAAAERLRACLRPEDTAARLGGDEFTILLEGITSEGEATRVAERVAEELRAPFVLGDHELTTTVSIGIVLGASGVDRPENLLRNADVAMYEAKNGGKDHHRVFSKSMHARVLGRLKLEAELRRAIEREEFKVYTNPRYGSLPISVPQGTRRSSRRRTRPGSRGWRPSCAGSTRSAVWCLLWSSSRWRRRPA